MVTHSNWYFYQMNFYARLNMLYPTPKTANATFNCSGIDQVGIVETQLCKSPEPI